MRDFGVEVLLVGLEGEAPATALVDVGLALLDKTLALGRQECLNTREHVIQVQLDLPSAIPPVVGIDSYAITAHAEDKTYPLLVEEIRSFGSHCPEKLVRVNQRWEMK